MAEKKNKTKPKPRQGKDTSAYKNGNRAQKPEDEPWEDMDAHETVRKSSGQSFRGNFQ